MEFDRFDIVSAHYTFYSDWYNGQGDPLYARLCKITNKLRFNPGPLWKGYESLSDNGQMIYELLFDKHPHVVQE